MNGNGWQFEDWGMKLKHAIYLSGLAIQVITAVLLFILLWMILFQGNPPAVVVIPFTTDRDMYAPGETVTISGRVTRHIEAPVEIFADLVCHDEIVASEFRALAGLPVGEDQRVVVRYRLPENLFDLGVIPGDTCHRSSKVVFQVNFMVKRAIFWRTEPFTIIEKSDEPTP